MSGAPLHEEPLLAKLRGEVLDARWQDLAPHFARQALLLIAPTIDLLEVAATMARDDVPRIQALLEAGALARPSADDADRWSAQPVRFQAVIVQPWVLAQPLGPASAAPPDDA